MSLQDMFLELRQDRGQVAEEKKTFQEIDNFTCCYCHESSLVVDEGSYTCTSCGRDNGVVISEKQEWRSFDGNKDLSRCGMPSHPLLPQASLGTVAQSKSSYSRLQLQHAIENDERNILNAIKLIKKASVRLKIDGTLADKACYLYVQLIKKVKLKRGDVRKALMANCQFSICQRNGNHSYVCPEKLAGAYEITIKKYNEGSKLFAELLHHKTSDTAHKWGGKLMTSKKSFIKPTEPENIIRSVCNKLSFKDIEIANIIYIARFVKKIGLLSSKMPQSIASGCILLYVKHAKISIKISKVANFCTVSDATAKNTYNELKAYAKFLIAKDEDDLINGKVGDCMPQKKLTDIYKGPKMPTLILKSEEDRIKVNRGRPKKK
jgi:transcription initiation factor TFIIIB Brf1 subunit/transcription initiation factor TFIIB